MTIGEVGQQVDVTVDTLRYYEKIGLIEHVPRVGGKRDYQEEHVERIRFILCMKKAGFALEDIISFIALYKKGEQTLDQRLCLLLKQKQILLKELQQKEQVLDFLNYKIDLYTQKKEVKGKRKPII